MLKPDKALEDLARMAGGTASVFSGLRQQIREEIRARIDELALRLDLVPREDFETLEMRVQALESRLKTLETAPSKAVKKTAPKSKKTSGKTSGKAKSKAKSKTNKGA